MKKLYILLQKKKKKLKLNIKIFNINSYNCKSDILANNK